MASILEKRVYVENLSVEHYLGDDKRRCACLVQLSTGLRIASVFLSGGRFEDESFASEEDSANMISRGTQRVREISAAIERWNPDVVVGDFNADLDDAEEQLQTRMSPGRKVEYLSWRHSPFPILESCGYAMRKLTDVTSSFMHRVDHVFYRESKLRSLLQNVLDLTMERKLSDHNSVVVSMVTRGVYYRALAAEQFVTGEKGRIRSRNVKLGKARDVDMTELLRRSIEVGEHAYMHVAKDSRKSALDPWISLSTRPEVALFFACKDQPVRAQR